MSRLFNNTVPEYLYRNSAIQATPPFAWSCWCRVNDKSVINNFLWLGDKDATNQCHRMGYSSAGYCFINSNDGTSKLAITSGDITENEWFHLVGIIASDTDRRIIRNAIDKGTESTSISPSGIDRFTIGIRGNDEQLDQATSGNISEVAIWDLSSWPGATASDKADSFEAIVSNLVSEDYLPSDYPTGLVSYWDLLWSIRDKVGSNDLTAVGTVEAQHYPYIFSPISSSSNFIGSIDFEVSNLIGSISSASSLSGNLNSAITLIGSISSASSLLGNLNAATKLLGAISSASSLSGNLNSAITLIGYIASSSSLSGNLNSVIQFTGSISSASSLSGSFTNEVPLIGSISSASNLSGNLNSAIKLAGSIASLSSLSGNLNSAITLIGSIASLSSLSGNLNSAITLIGYTASSSSLSGVVEMPVNLVGNVLSSSGIIGELTVIRYNNLAGNSLCSTNLIALLEVYINLFGNCVSVSITVGEIREPIYLQGAIFNDSSHDNWLSPTSFIDNANWVDESRAYDGNVNTFAGHSYIFPRSWSGFLQLLHSSIWCNKIRYYEDLWLPNDLYDLDVYYNNSWHNLYQGKGSLTGVWKTHNLNGIYKVSRVRIRRYNSDGEYRSVYIHEVNFNEYMGSLLYGLLTFLLGLSGTCEVNSSLNADLQVIKSLQDSINSYSNIYSDLSFTYDYRGSISSNSNISGNLTVEKSINSQVFCYSSVISSLHQCKELIGHSTSFSILSGLLTNIVSLNGLSLGVSYLSADRLNTIILESEILGITQPLGNAYASLEVLTSLESSILDTSNLYSNFSLIINLIGEIDSESNLFADRLNTIILDGSVSGVTEPFGNAIGACKVETTLQSVINSKSNINSLQLLEYYIGFYERLTNQITTYFQSIADSNNLIVRYDDDCRDTPSNELWCFCSIDYGSCNKSSIGANRFRNIGNLNIKIKNPIGLGISEILSTADIVANAFRNINLNNIIFEVPRVRNVGRIKDDHQYNVICPFFSDRIG
jgi:hypothetical protein